MAKTRGGGVSKTGRKVRTTTQCHYNTLSPTQDLQEDKEEGEEMDADIYANCVRNMP